MLQVTKITLGLIKYFSLMEDRQLSLLTIGNELPCSALAEDLSKFLIIL